MALRTENARHRRVAHVVVRVITADIFVTLLGGALRDDTKNGCELVEYL